MNLYNFYSEAYEFCFSLCPKIVHSLAANSKFRNCKAILPSSSTQIKKKILLFTLFMESVKSLLYTRIYNELHLTLEFMSWI